MNQLRITILAATALVVVCSSLPAGEVRLKSEARCAGSLVRLSDIAEIDPATSADATALGDLVLFPVPGAGKSRQLRGQELRELLALCGVEAGEVTLSGAESVVIHAGAAETTTIIRPALHLIPARAYIKRGAASAELRKDPAKDAPAKLVGRNQAVSIHSLWPGVKVTASGKALADGALGESVLIEDADTRERVLAKVVGPQTVEIRPAKH